MWKNLTAGQQADIIGMAAKQGITNIKDIEALYDKSITGNSYPFGGNSVPMSREEILANEEQNFEEAKREYYIRQEIERENFQGTSLQLAVNKIEGKDNQYAYGGPTKPNFVLRLEDPNRKYIKDWINSDDIATHKLGWFTEEDHAVVYPEVQEINGKLIDFTRPPYARNAGIESAIQRGDTIRMTPRQAEWFTQMYKGLYPKGNIFAEGGFTGPDDPEELARRLQAAVNASYRQTPIVASDNTNVKVPAQEVQIDPIKVVAQQRYPMLKPEVAQQKVIADEMTKQHNAEVKSYLHGAPKEEGLQMVSPILKPFLGLAGLGIAGSTYLGARTLPYLFAGIGAKNFYDAGKENSQTDTGALKGFIDYVASPEGALNALFMAPVANRTIKVAEPFVEATKDAAYFNLANKGTGARMLYPWQSTPKVTGNITAGSVVSSAPALKFTASGKPYFTNTLDLQQPATLFALNQGKNALSLPQSTGIYPQIKPLVKGAEIEKQLSKSGTISRNQLESYIAKQGKYYQEVMKNVLDTEFKDVKKIDYNAFKDAVQRTLPEYSRVPQTQYEAYGMKNIGFQKDIDLYEGVRDVINTATTDAQKIEAIKLYGISAEATGLGRLNITADSNGNYTLSEEQKNGLDKLYNMFVRRVQREIPDTRTFTFETDGIAGNNKHYDGNPIGHSRTFTMDDDPETLYVVESQSDWAQEFDRPVVRRRDDNGNDLPVLSPLTQKHLADTYLERQIQENLKYAAEKGLTKMRYPTRRTAARIEGYPSQTSERDEAMQEYTNAAYNDPDVTFGKGELIYANEETKKYYEDWWKKIEALSNEPRYASEFETILRKYDNFVKLYKKLFGKDVEIKVVNDSRGASWYEVEVPESYRNKTTNIIMSGAGLVAPIGAITDND